MFNKTKTIKKSNRGITFSDPDLFPIHSKYQYFIDKKNKKVIICLVDEDTGTQPPHSESLSNTSLDTMPSYNGTVSRKKRNEESFIPLVDIRNSEALQQFENCEKLTISISDEVILVEGVTAEGEEVAYAFDKQHLFELLNIVAEDSTVPLKLASFFAGCGCGDAGFKEAGFELVFALEKDAEAAETYRTNHGDHIVVQDILDFDGSQLSGVEVALGSPPCVDYTPVNRKTNKWQKPINTLTQAYINVLKQMPDLKVWVLENAKQFLTAGNGTILQEIQESLPDFEISHGVLNSLSYGSPQDRQRTILIGSKIGKIDLPLPTVDRDNYKTVGEALEGITDDLPNQGDITISKPETLERMKHVSQGGNWRDIPKYLLPKRFGENTHSSIYKRLDLNKPSIAITNVRKSNILHPLHDRILSIREAARLFDLKDDFIFKGTLSSKQQQIANGITANLAKAIGTQIKEAFKRLQYTNMVRNNVWVH